MKDRTDTEVLIDGRKYTISGKEGDEYMQKIASYINRKLTGFREKESYRHMDMDLRNVLLALNIADDYYKEKNKSMAYKTEGEQKDQQILDMKHEIMSMQEKIKDYELKNGVLEASVEEAQKKIIELETQQKQRTGSKGKR